MRAGSPTPMTTRPRTSIEASELEVGTHPHPLRRDHAGRRPCRQRACRNRRPPTSIAGSCRASRSSAVQAELAGDRRSQGQGQRPTGPARPSPPSPLREDVLGAYTRSVRRIYGDERRSSRTCRPAPPTACSSARSGSRSTGSRRLGHQPDDERAHGLDERIPVRALYDNTCHWEMMLKDLAG